MQLQHLAATLSASARACRLALRPAPAPTLPGRAQVIVCGQQRDSDLPPVSATQGSWWGAQVQLYKTMSGATTLAAVPRLATAPRTPARHCEQLGGDDASASTLASGASGALATLPQQWAELPAQYKLVFATSMSFVICNMDKVNISVAILAMSHDFGWSPTTSGLVQSSFFYGYLLSQIPGGYAASLVGGRKVLPAGVALWSAATAAVPLLVGTLPGLFMSRAAVGLGEGVAPSAAMDIVARAIPTDQRSRAISFIFGGLHVGSLLGLLVAPPCIERFGWPSVFYIFGGVGLVWCLWWERLMAEIKEQDPELAKQLTGAGRVPDAAQQQQQGQGQGQVRQLGDSALRLEAEGDASMAGHGGHGGVIDARQPVPWRAFLRNPALWALGYTHFCNNWFHYTMLAWMPTYFTDSLSLDLSHAAQVSLLPPVAAIAASALAGPSADALIAHGVPVETVRKVAQCVAFLGPAACLMAASLLEGSSASVVLVTLSLGLASFSLAGLYSNHADLSPRYASVLLGMTNTSGALPGIVGVAFTGLLFDVTGSWGWSFFAPSIFFFLTGSAAYVLWGSASRQDYSEEANSEPFAVERWLGALQSGLGGEGGKEE